MPKNLDLLQPLSVILPAYNAARELRPTLDEVSAWLRHHAIEHEIIVVDDGSSDDTGAIARAHPAGVRALRSDANRGKGYAVRRGMLAARGAWRVFMDVDNSTKISNLERFAAVAAQGAAIVIASRRVAGAQIVRKQHPLRQFLGRCFPYLVRAVALPQLRDSQCGFKLFRADAAEAIFRRLRVERFAFDVEALLLGERLGYSAEEVPIDWDNPTQSTLRMSTDTFRMFYDVFASVWRVRFSRQIPEPAEM